LITFQKKADGIQRAEDHVKKALQPHTRIYEKNDTSSAKSISSTHVYIQGKVTIDLSQHWEYLELLWVICLLLSPLFGSRMLIT